MALEDGRHPDAERLAEYADGVLDAEGREAVERHLADCSECRAIVMETMAFLASNPAIAVSAPAPRVPPLRSWRWVTGVVVGLAAAAALVLAIRVARPEWGNGLFGPRGDRPELQELIAAVANEPTRPVEGRLSGGFKYAPPPSPTRGPGDRELSPDVRIAAAKIEKQARGTSKNSEQAALGVALIVSGEFDQAISVLEKGLTREPQSPTLLNDLAIAYLARAQRTGRADDFPRALDTVNRGLQLSNVSAELAFNRALILEQLYLKDEAIHAWQAYLAADTASEWANEARRHLDRLRAPAGIS